MLPGLQVTNRANQPPLFVWILADQRTASAIVDFSINQARTAASARLSGKKSGGSKSKSGGGGGGGGSGKVIFVIILFVVALGKSVMVKYSCCKVSLLAMCLICLMGHVQRC